MPLPTSTAVSILERSRACRSLRGSAAGVLTFAALSFSGVGCTAPIETFSARPESEQLATLAAAPDPYDGYRLLRGDLHLHSSTGSFDARQCPGDCQPQEAHEQLQAARAAGLDFAALTEHDRDPNTPGELLSEELWARLIHICEDSSNADFVALCGYEWTPSQKSCVQIERTEPDYNHKVVLLPPGSQEICNSLDCPTPNSLASFMAEVSAIGFTPHPWRFLLIGAEAGFPAYVARDYFDYDPSIGDEPWIGAEVGPDFVPLPKSWAWPLVCERPQTPLQSQTVTLPEWSAALAQGKRLAALATSDRHFAFTSFTQRTTLVYARELSAASLFEALRARRTLASYLEPFELKFSIGGKPVGATTSRGPIRLELTTPADEVKEMHLRSPRGTLSTWQGAQATGAHELPLPDDDPGPFWVEVYGHEIDAVVGTPRTTISSPIWRLAPGR